MQSRCGGAGGGGAGRLAVVKLGGSIVTVKSEAFTLRIGDVSRIAEELAAAAKAGWRLLLVLGGGSYGHTVVSEFRGAGEFGSPESLSATTSAMIELALAVADILSGYGLAPVLYPPHSFCEPAGLKPNCEWRYPARALQAGATPVVFGDAVPSSTGGVVIVSGDELAMEAACALGADSVVYLTNVPGVLDERGEVIPVVTGAGLAELLGHVGGGSGVDVTGGMRRKLLAVKELGCPGVRVVVADGRRRGSLLSALRGEGGTVILL